MVRGRDLIIAEGIEKAAAYWHRPASIWVAGTAGRLPAMASFVHPLTREVSIDVDRDDAGRRGAVELAGLIEELGVPAYLIERGAR